MPWQSTIDRRRRLVYTRVTGTITMADASAHQAELAQDPEFDPTFAHILDLRAVQTVLLSTNELRTLAQSKVFAPFARRALLAGDPSTFGLAQIYGFYRESATGDSVTAVKTIEEAYAWVGATQAGEPTKES